MIVQADSTAGFPLADSSVQCVVTSPPYWGLRDYGIEGQLGLERTPEEYVERIVEVFREVWRVLRDDGTVWLNLGDSFYGSWANYSGGNRGAGKQRLIKQGSQAQNPVWEGMENYRPAATYKHPVLKPKDLIGIPWRVAFALQADGWYLRSDIIWHKPNPMPESVTDRPTKAHEYLFLLSKAQRYYYDHEAIKEESIYPGGPNYPESIKSPYGQGFTRKAESGEAKRDKQRGHSRRHAGFNDRWDGMTKEEQCSVGRNKRDVWTIPTTPSPEAHFAVFPEALVEPCILAGLAPGDVVLDPFGGTGTTVKVAQRLGRKGIAMELSAEYCKMARDKTWQTARQAQML